MRTILELIRILLLLFILGGIMGALVNYIYSYFGINMNNAAGEWLVGLSILILFFVLYRNKLQYSGFYKGEGRVKLSRTVSISLISSSIFMLIIVPLFR